MITHDAIEEKARKLYITSGNVEGHDLDNWFNAERIVWNGVEEETQCMLELRITPHSIEKVARKLYVTSGSVEGHDLDNWFDAERIVWNGIEEETQCMLELRT